MCVGGVCVHMCLLLSEQNVQVNSRKCSQGVFMVIPLSRVGSWKCVGQNVKLSRINFLEKKSSVISQVASKCRF